MRDLYDAALIVEVEEGVEVQRGRELA